MSWKAFNIITVDVIVIAIVSIVVNNNEDCMRLTLTVSAA